MEMQKNFCDNQCADRFDCVEKLNHDVVNFGIDWVEFVDSLKNDSCENHRGLKRKWITEQEKEVDEYLKQQYDIIPEEYKESSLFYILVKDDILKNILLDYKNYLENIEEWNEYSPCKRPKLEHTSIKTLIPHMVNSYLMNSMVKNISEFNSSQNESDFEVDFDNFLSQRITYETQNIYTCHLIREMQRKGLVATTSIFDSRVSPNIMSKLSQSIENFKKTKARRKIFQKAENINLESLNYRTFYELLNSLFTNGGVTWERIMVLFFFCTDISIRAVREKLIDKFMNIFTWTINFITFRLSSFVQNQGGWDCVLSIPSCNKIMFYGTFCIGAGLLTYYLLSKNKML